MILRTLAWKDGREVAVAWAALLVCAMPLLWTVDVDVAVDHLLPGVTVAAGLMLGVVLLAGEAEGGTLALLDWMLPRREPVWRTKCILGMAAVVGLAAVLGAATVVRGGPVANVASQVLNAIAAGLLGLAWGLLTGGVQRSVLRAAAWAVVGYLITWTLLAVLTIPLAGELRGVIQLALAGVLLWAGEWTFSRPTRRSAAAAPAKRRPRGVLIWLWWRQTRWALVLVPALAFLSGLILQVPSFFCLWTLAATLVGWVCGLGVLGPEQPQTWAAWGQQGWPVRRLWLVKWCGWAAVLAASQLAIGVGYAVATRLGTGDGPYTDFSMLLRTGLWLLLLFGACWSFALTPLVMLATERRLTALFVSLGLSSLMVAAWLPSIVGGGVPTWVGLAGPIVLILGAGWLVQVWSYTGPSWPQRLKVAGLVAVVIAGSIGFFGWRAHEIAEVDVPLGAAAAPPAPLSAEAKQAAAQLQEILQGLIAGPSLPLMKVDEAWHQLNAALQQPDQTMPKFGRAVHLQVFNQLFPAGIVDDLEKVCATGQPLPANYSGPIREGDWVRIPWQRLRTGLRLRAQAESEAGRQDRAWRCINLLLTLSRRVRWAPNVSLHDQCDPLELEMDGFHAVARWLAGPPASAEVVARALADLRRHEAELPDVLAEGQRLAAAWLREGATRPFGVAHLRFERASRERIPWRATFAHLDATLEVVPLVPWEQQRQQRRFRAVTAGWLEHLRTFDPRDEKEFVKKQRFWEDLILAKLAVVPTLAGGQIAPEQLREWAVQQLDGFYFADLARERTLTLALVRGLQAQFAVLAFQLTENRVPESLEQLVPRFLPAVPISPYSGQPFNGSGGEAQQRFPEWPRFHVSGTGPPRFNPVPRWDRKRIWSWDSHAHVTTLMFGVPPWGLK